MSSNPTASREVTVFQVENDNEVGSHWTIGVDYYDKHEVTDIVNRVFPGIYISFYHSDYLYASLDFDTLHGIWDDSGLRNYRYIPSKFDCDDFAVCLKAQASKYSYNQSLPDDKGSLCGIIWGKRTDDNGKIIVHAFNFTIDPFEKVILFEPQNGQLIAYNVWTPFFCMV